MEHKAHPDPNNNAQNQFAVIEDTGATGHYWPPTMLHLLYDVHQTNEVTINLPDHSKLQSTYSGYFHHGTLPKEACLV